MSSRFHKEFNMANLQNYRLTFRIFCVLNELAISDLDLIIYLDPIKYFTIHDFKNGQTTMAWDKTRFYRLLKQGWLKKIYSGSGRTGGHSKYVVSVKGKQLLTRIAKCLDGREDLPVLKNPKGYKQKILVSQAKRHNKLKYKRDET